jgi:hypothetical protein
MGRSLVKTWLGKFLSGSFFFFGIFFIPDGDEHRAVDDELDGNDNETG